jgi:hypothetical protein
MACCQRRTLSNAYDLAGAPSLGDGVQHLEDALVVPHGACRLPSLADRLDKLGELGLMFLDSQFL